jgi:hypothetical protein
VFEVVTGDRLAFRTAFHDTLEPAREALVEVGPLLLGQALVGGVPDQEVPEAERVLAGELGTVRSDQLLADESEQTSLHLGPELLGGEGRHSSDVEELALYRGPAEDVALA